jgi:hypothetical protein
MISGARPVVKDILSHRGVFKLLGEGNDFSRRLYALEKAASLLGIKV